MNKLLLSAFVSFLSLAPSVHAHQVWIEQQGNTATLQFGEFADNLRETSPGLLDKFVAPTAILLTKNGERTLKLDKTPQGFVLSSTAAPGETIVAEEASYPIFENSRDGKVTRTAWTPAARYITDFAERQPKLTFDIVPTGQPGQFKVFYKGQPAAKVKASAVIPSGWTKEATSNEQGILTFELPWSGTYVIEGHYTDKTAGERGGKPFDTASFVTSLSFVHPKGIAPVPAGPAATPAK